MRIPEEGNLSALRIEAAQTAIDRNPILPVSISGKGTHAVEIRRSLLI